MKQLKDIICTFRMNYESKKKLEMIAAENDRTFSSQVRIILEAYLEKKLS